MQKILDYHLGSGIRVALLSFALVQVTNADVLELTDKELWIDLVGEFTTIDFTGYKDGTFITDQYADLGILFTDGNDNIHHTCSYENDCWGLDSGDSFIDMEFASPQTYIAVDHPGGMKFELFSKGILIYTSSDFYGGGTGFFFSVISSGPFDSVLISDPIDDAVSIDDLHFGFLPPGDIDQDGVVGTADLLLLLSVWGDFCPDTCPGDIDDDDETDTEDLLELLEAWGLCDDCEQPENCPADIDENCIVGVSDLLSLLSSWGDCPDHDFIPCQGDITFDGQVNTNDLLLLLDNWGS